MDCLHTEQIAEANRMYCEICGIDLGQIKSEPYPSFNYGADERSTHNRRMYFMKALDLKLGLPLEKEAEQRVADLVADLKQSGAQLSTRKEVLLCLKTKFARKYVARICVLLGHPPPVLGQREPWKFGCRQPKAAECLWAAFCQ